MRYSRQRMAILWPNAVSSRQYLPESLTNVELRGLYFHPALAPTTTLGERGGAAAFDRGRVQRMDVALTVPASGGTYFGLCCSSCSAAMRLPRAGKNHPLR